MFTSDFAICFMAETRSPVSAKALLKFWIAVSVSAFMCSPPSRSWDVFPVRPSSLRASSRLPPEHRPLTVTITRCVAGCAGSDVLWNLPDHRGRVLDLLVPLCLGRPQPHCREGQLHRIRRPQVLPGVGAAERRPRERTAWIPHAAKPQV